MLHVRRRWTRTPKILTALSRPCPAGHTNTGQHFSKNPDRIRTADRIKTDRIRTDRHRTGHGQCCPPTSEINPTIFLLRMLIERFNLNQSMRPYTGRAPITRWPEHCPSFKNTTNHGSIALFR